MKLKYIGLALFTATVLNTVPVFADDTNPIITEITSVHDLSTEEGIKNAIKDFESKIASLEEENKTLDKQIKDNEKSLRETAETIIKRQAKLKKQLSDVQTSQKNQDVLSVLLDAENLSDAIKKISAMSKLSESNSNQIEQLKELKTNLEKDQKENQEKINTLDKNRKAINTKQEELKLEKLRLEQIRLDEESARQEELARQIATASTSVSAARQAESGNVIVPSNNYVNRGTFYDASTYPAGECTWGVKSLCPWVGPYWGNANQWTYSAQAAGYSVGTTPVPGAIAVWTGGAYGHVAYVTDVQSSTSIKVLESNYGGNRYVGDFRGWFNPQATSEGQVFYVYP